MKKFLFALLLVLLLGLPLARVNGQQPGTAEPLLTSPLPGQAVQGNISLVGSTVVEGFRSAEISFAYTGDPSAWFLIAESQEPVDQSTLAQWDTTTISDGDYTLRLLVYRTSGDPLEALVEGVRVRNYTPVEADTPTPLPPYPLVGQDTTPSPSPFPWEATPTPMGGAAASESQDQPQAGTFFNGLLRGAGVVVIAFGLLGLYGYIRTRRKEE